MNPMFKAKLNNWKVREEKKSLNTKLVGYLTSKTIIVLEQKLHTLHIQIHFFFFVIFIYQFYCLELF